MTPSFALNLSNDGIGLLHRTARGWLAVGEAALDDPALTQTLGFLRTTALALEPNGISTALILPNEQILYVTLNAPGPAPRLRRAQIEAELEGRTPYSVADLVYDWSGSGAEVQVAVIARETLAEAEEFALAHRFNPVTFVAIPPPGAFAGTAFFGATRNAAELGEDAKPERETQPMRIIGADQAGAAEASAQEAEALAGRAAAGEAGRAATGEAGRAATGEAGRAATGEEERVAEPDAAGAPHEAASATPIGQPANEHPDADAVNTDGVRAGDAGAGDAGADGTGGSKPHARSRARPPVPAPSKAAQVSITGPERVTEALVPPSPLPRDERAWGVGDADRPPQRSALDDIAKPALKRTAAAEAPPEQPGAVTKASANDDDAKQDAAKQDAALQDVARPHGPGPDIVGGRVGAARKPVAPRAAAPFAAQADRRDGPRVAPLGFTASGRVAEPKAFDGVTAPSLPPVPGSEPLTSDMVGSPGGHPLAETPPASEAMVQPFSAAEVAMGGDSALRKPAPVKPLPGAPAAKPAGRVAAIGASARPPARFVPLKPRADSADAEARPAAAARPAFGGTRLEPPARKPKRLGLILTLALVVLLAAIAIWSAQFMADQVTGELRSMDADVQLATGTEPDTTPAEAATAEVFEQAADGSGGVAEADPANERISDAALPVDRMADVGVEAGKAEPLPLAQTAPAPQTGTSAAPEGEEAAIAAGPAATAAGATVAELDGARSISGGSARLSLGAGDGNQQPVGTPPEVADAALPDTPTEDTVTKDTAPAGPVPLVAAENAAPGNGAAADVQIGALVGAPLPQQAAPVEVKLPDLAPVLQDEPPQSPLPPAPYGTAFMRDARGFIVATPEGALTPDGVVVRAGRPPTVPPARTAVTAADTGPAPDAAEAPALLSANSAGTGEAGSEPQVALPVDPRLAAFRPRPRPGSAVSAPAQPAASGQPPSEAAPATADPAVVDNGDDAALDAEGATSVAALRPRVRPATAPAISEPQDPGAGLAAAVALSDAAGVAMLKPRVRPQIEAAVAPPEQAPAERSANADFAAASAQAVAASRRPGARPRDFSPAVDQALAAAVVVPAVATPPARPQAPARAPAPLPDPEPVIAAAPEVIEDDAEPEIARAAPPVPTRASVAKSATVANMISLREVNLIGVFGTSANRQALVRLGNGRVQRVKVGDRVDGGKVAAIGSDELRYVKNGRNLRLELPRDG